MGLEAVPASPDSVAEKRRKLLGALQRCDDDLKALKKIIEAVRSSDPPSPAAVSRSDGGFGDKVRTVTEVKLVIGEQQQPSPVSVLDEFTRSPLSPNCHSGRHSFGQFGEFFSPSTIKIITVYYFSFIVGFLICFLNGSSISINMVDRIESVF